MVGPNSTGRVGALLEGGREVEAARTITCMICAKHPGRHQPAVALPAAPPIQAGEEKARFGFAARASPREETTPTYLCLAVGNVI